MAATLKQSLDNQASLTVLTLGASALAAWEAMDGRYVAALAAALVGAFTGYRLWKVRQIDNALSDSLGLDN